ncbi:hypothetical protein N7532_002885 [Penicillium argentinense]|uniref:Uncharacterized protein n=1 Tax=Penicillium argentinense TaxID=1131581 RepID=A0A9W9G259_9EURO|nr:uncharacterized protein N7532_002885 [Penicillium argentinense]KAJ5110240.1 hypothetical protein N7532_002885 [Penicillium argentinense]
MERFEDIQTPSHTMSCLFLVACNWASTGMDDGWLGAKRSISGRKEDPSFGGPMGKPTVARRPGRKDCDEQRRAGGGLPFDTRLGAPSTPSTTARKTARVELPVLNTLRTILRSLAVSTKPRRTFLISRRIPGDFADVNRIPTSCERADRSIRSGPTGSTCIWSLLRAQSNAWNADSGYPEFPMVLVLAVVLFSVGCRVQSTPAVFRPRLDAHSDSGRSLDLFPDGPSGRENNGPCEACAVANEAFVVGPLASNPRLPIRGCHASRLVGSGVGVNHVVCVGVLYDGDSSKVQLVEGSAVNRCGAPGVGCNSVRVIHAYRMEISPEAAQHDRPPPSSCLIALALRLEPPSSSNTANLDARVPSLLTHTLFAIAFRGMSVWRV